MCELKPQRKKVEREREKLKIETDAIGFILCKIG